MTHIKAFNKSISSLIEGGNNTAYDTIHELKKEFNNYKDYYSMLDSLSFRLGFDMIAEIFYNKDNKTTGYIPKLKYHPNNKLDKEPEIEYLGISEPLKIEDCYEILAKNCLYQMTSINNLTELLKK